MENDKEKFKREFKKRLYNLTLNTISFLDGLPKDNVSKRVGDQLLRSTTSIIGNYIEGQAASSRKDFVNYFNISFKSANESKLWFSILKDSNRANADDVIRFLGELDEISKIFGSSIITLKNKR